ncbi:pseudouridine synthase [uncultured Rothia sp.]|uniref:pseudouridine synthase n=1 Tax=uncultured Rothia sp. TaxID=316088 RepID=UPI0032165B03
MARRKKIVSAPLPQRKGVDPVRLKLPVIFPQEYKVSGSVPSLADYLIARFYSHRPDYVFDLLERGEIVDDDGVPLTTHTPYPGGGSVWYYRELTVEPGVPTDLPVLYEDEWVLAIDKPHFLATTPSGMFVANTALTLLRHERRLPLLSPVHRLDRLTAGVLVLAKVPEARAPLQKLFQNREISKSYEAVAPLIEGMVTGDSVEVRSHIEKQRGVLQVVQHLESRCGQLGLTVNAISTVKLARIIEGKTSLVDSETTTSAFNPHRTHPDPQQSLGFYELTPHTGKTHQLRAHMFSLGAPIFGDTFYPQVLDTAPDNPALPLQLLARQLSFIHPFTSEKIILTSNRYLTLTHNVSRFPLV